MEALIKSIKDLFGSTHRYLVPPYQRPYVWTEERQWLPLWEDVERVADARVGDREDHHFLGAIVIRRERTPPGGITEWSVIDGQQRLTTLQLMITAMAAAARSDDLDREARLLEKLAHHDADEAEGDDRFKFWPTTVNRDAFRQVMREGGPAIEADDPENTVHEAWEFFRARAANYAHSDAAEGDEVAMRYGALREAVTGLLQVVTISLDRDDPAQVIFETLNARGTPLLAMDLVKNALFEAAEQQGASIDSVHDTHWAAQLGDHAYWGADTRLGRVTAPRSEAFLMHWLAMRLGELIPSDELFDLFRRRVLLVDGTDAVDLVRTLNQDATILRSFDSLPPRTMGRRFFDTLTSLDTTTMHPVALFLFRSPEISDDRRDRALAAIESYLVRRLLLGLSTKDYSRLAARLIARSREDLLRTDETISAELLASQSDTYRWPGDDELTTHLETHQLYGWLGQKRIVMVLAMLELAARRGKVEEIDALPARLQIEHIMPSAWPNHWPVEDSADDEAVDRRNSHVNLLGNLTLVAGALNGSMSNAAWEMKRPKLAENSLLLLNREICARPTWDEHAIAERGRSLTARIIDRWPGP